MWQLIGDLLNSVAIFCSGFSVVMLLEPGLSDIVDVVASIDSVFYLLNKIVVMLNSFLSFQAVGVHLAVTNREGMVDRIKNEVKFIG